MRPLLLSLLAIASPITIASADTKLPFYASVGVSLTQTNTAARTDAPPVAFFVGDPGELPQFPEEWPLNGLPFDDDDTGWTAAFGYQFTDYFAVELGYEELGTFQASARIINAGGAAPIPVTIEATGFSLAAQFGYPLSEQLRATWQIGAVRAGFEANGDAVVGFLIAPFPEPPGTVVAIPYSDPDDEIGYRYGFGLSWAFNEHFEAELAYSRQDLKVLDFDSFGLRLIGRL